jgi:hypothetical protein
LSRYERPNTVIQFQLFYKYKNNNCIQRCTTVNETILIENQGYWHQVNYFKSVKYNPFYFPLYTKSTTGKNISQNKVLHFTVKITNEKYLHNLETISQSTDLNI